MSQSSNSKENTNMSSKPPMSAVDNKVISASGERAAKRAAPDSPETQTKKIMVNHSSCEEQVSSLGLMSSDQPRFVNAASIVANARTNVQMIPEISDKELLEMAIQFEMKHPQ